MKKKIILENHHTEITCGKDNSELSSGEGTVLFVCLFYSFFVVVLGFCFKYLFIDLLDTVVICWLLHVIFVSVDINVVLVPSLVSLN